MYNANLSIVQYCTILYNMSALPVARGNIYTVIPRLTKIIRSRITFVSRSVISRRFL